MIPAGIALAFHHVGVACAEIDAEAQRLRPLGYRDEGGRFSDPGQGVLGQFLAGQAPRLELLQALPGTPEGVLSPWLARETKLYHLAYLTDDLEHAIGHFRHEGAKLVVAPMAAVAFDGRNIAFVMLRNGLLVELIAAK